MTTPGDESQSLVFLFFLFSQQVVELISSAIGDVVQGLYYENCNSAEVKLSARFLLFHICQKGNWFGYRVWNGQLKMNIVLWDFENNSVAVEPLVGMFVKIHG